MTASFFFALRDGLEAALIVGLVAAYVTKLKRRDLLGQVLLGAAAAIVVCVIAGAAALIFLSELPEIVQATFEGTTAVLAIVILTWMLFWMRRQGRVMKGNLERDVDVALSRGAGMALVLMAFLAVAREGLELTLVLLPLLTASTDNLLIFVAGVAGLLTAAAIGYAIFRLGIRVNLARFFTVTGVILIFVAAGLAMYAVHEFHEAGYLSEGAVLFDVSGSLPETGVLGSLLAGLVGYQEAPTVVQGIVYVAYLIPVLGLFLMAGRQPRRQAAAPA
jgi:high-affinity iron transporter